MFNAIRPDFRYIVNTIPAGSRVLDLGCGDGALLFLLQKNKVNARGIEKDPGQVIQALERGVTVRQGDLEESLLHYADKSFDFIIINQTLQQTFNPEENIRECLRVARKVIIVFPNSAHYKVRMEFLISGKTPVTELMPLSWYQGPNLRFFSVDDFRDFCKQKHIRVEATAFFSGDSEIKIFPELMAELALFILSETPVFQGDHI